MANINYYSRYRLRKPTGGYRWIEEPNAELLAQQKIILEHLSTIQLPAFITHRRGSNLTQNSQPHLGAALYIKFDLSDFFHTVRPSSIREGLKLLGGLKYLELIPDCLVDLPGRSYLPQGAPTSPLLANIGFYPTDLKILELTTRYQLTYTRWVDDLTFSSKAPQDLRPFKKQLIQLLHEDGFQVNHKKTEVRYYSEIQQVTGITVNSSKKHLVLSRHKKKQLRAKLNNCAYLGESLSPQLQGELSFLRSIEPVYFTKLMKYYHTKVERFHDAR